MGVRKPEWETSGSGGRKEGRMRARETAINCNFVQRRGSGRSAREKDKHREVIHEWEKDGRMR